MLAPDPLAGLRVALWTTRPDASPATLPAP